MTLRRLMPALVLACCLCGRASGEGEKWRELTEAGWKACQQGHFENAREVLVQAADESVGDNLRRALTLSVQAWLEVRDGKREAAEAFAGKALALYDQKELTDADSARGLNLLALVSLDLKRPADAEVFARRAVAVQEQAAGKDSILLVPLLCNEAAACEQRGRLTAVEPLYQRALAIQEAALGKEHADLAPTLDRLGGFLHERGRNGEAEPLFRRSLAVRERAKAGDADLAVSLSNLAGVCAATGKDGEAEALFRRALELREKAPGKDQLDLALASSNLAVVLARRSEPEALEAAEKLLETALALREKVGGPNDASAARTHHNLGGVFQAAGKYEEARSEYQKALEMKESALGKDSPEVATTLEALASLAEKRPKLIEKPESLLQRAVTIRERALGKTHASLAEPLAELANVYRRDPTKRPDAESFFIRSLVVRRRAGETTGPEYAKFLDGYAAYLRELKRPADAKTLENQAAEARKGRAD